MSWLDTTLQILTVVVTLVSALMGAQLWKVRSENRKSKAEASSHEATATATVTQTALSLVGPLSAKNTELNDQVNAWEKYERAQSAWNSLVQKTVREAAPGLTLPLPPEPPY